MARVSPASHENPSRISRFASTIDGLYQGHLVDDEFEAIVERDLQTGQHRNPTGEDRWFTTAYFHLPEGLRGEAEEAGLVVEGLFGIEGPAANLPDLDTWLEDPVRREKLLAAVRRVEAAPDLLGVSPHLLIVGRRR